MIKVLVTGSKGVVGSKLVERLKSKGFDVFGIDLFHTNDVYAHGLGKLKGKEDYFRCDISEFRQLEYIIEYVRPLYVFNCAAEFGRWNGEFFYEQVWKSNVIGLKHLLSLQTKHRFKLVHCSSSEVYGDYSGVMYEDVLKNTPVCQMNDYAISKRVNEMQIQNHLVMFPQTETVLIRIFNTYGPGEWYHPFRSVNCLFCYNLLMGRPITVYAGHARTSTYIYDAVNTISNIIDNFISGETFNIGGSVHHTIEYLSEIILVETKADPSLVKHVDYSEILTTKDKIVDISKSEKLLNHTNSYSLEEGVAQTIFWMREFYRL